MQETSKCYAKRLRLGHFDKYLTGFGIDVGCGDDILKAPTAKVVPWDLPQGDAQFLDGIHDLTFDFLYSSHCLEHMMDVSETLKNWTRVVRPGGYLYIVVPDYLLYEKLNFPSMFNEDHKQTFSLDYTREKVGRDNHFHIGHDLKKMLYNDLGMSHVSAELEDDGYDYSRGYVDQTRGSALAQICVICQRRSS